MQHMLEETKRLEVLKIWLTKLSKFVGTLSIGLFIYSSVLYAGDHVTMAVFEDWMDSTSTQFTQSEEIPLAAEDEREEEIKYINT